MNVSCLAKRTVRDLPILAFAFASCATPQLVARTDRGIRAEQSAAIVTALDSQRYEEALVSALAIGCTAGAADACQRLCAMCSGTEPAKEFACAGLGKERARCSGGGQ